MNASVSIEENISLKTSRLFSSLTSLKFTAKGRNKGKVTTFTGVYLLEFTFVGEKLLLNQTVEKDV